MPRFPPVSLSALRIRLATLRHIALDLDGTLYRGGRLFPETIPFLQSLADLAIGFTFLTNNSSLSATDYRKKLRALGFPPKFLTPGRVVTSTEITIATLRRRHQKVRTLLALGTASFRRELTAAGFRLIDPDQGRRIHPSARHAPDAVLLGFDQDLTYDRLCLASAWITRGKPFFATHLDLLCPSDADTVLVDAGAIAQALTAATGVEPISCGKPNPEVLHSICRRRRIRPGDLAMVGDRLYTDIAMAREAGALAVLVLTGESTRAAAQKSPTPPDVVFRNLHEFTQALQRARR